MLSATYQLRVEQAMAELDLVRNESAHVVSELREAPL